MLGVGTVNVVNFLGAQGIAPGRYAQSENVRHGLFEPISVRSNTAASNRTASTLHHSSMGEIIEPHSSSFS